MPIDLFVLMIFSSIFFAWLAPEIGASKRTISLSNFAQIGVSFIFFFYGLRLGAEKLKVGMKNLKLHILIQLSTFVAMPLMVLLAMQFFDTEKNYYLWLGVFFLAALPSTVSTSVVMVSIAKGNVPAAIFNATVSSLIGVFITPLWMLLFVAQTSGMNEVSDIFIKLLLQVLLPIILGALLHGKFGAVAEKQKKALRIFDQSIVILIAYTSFSSSFADGVFDGFKFSTIFILIFAAVLFFFAIYYLIKMFCKALNFNEQDTITAAFCGSKKSLMHASVMSKVLFQEAAVVGLLLLPVMIYHAAQIVIVSVIAKAYAKSKNAPNT